MVGLLTPNFHIKMGFMGASNLLVELFTLQSVHVFVKLRVSEAKFMSGLRQPGLVQLHYICPWTFVVKQFPGYSVTATRQLFSTKIRSQTPHKRYSLKSRAPVFFLRASLEISLCKALPINSKKSQMQQVGGYIS